MGITKVTIREGGIPKRNGIDKVWWTELWLSTDGRVRIGHTNAWDVAQPDASDMRWNLPEATYAERRAFFEAITPVLADLLTADPAERDRLHAVVADAIAIHYVLTSTTWPGSMIAGVSRRLEWAQAVRGQLVVAAWDALYDLAVPGITLDIPEPGGGRHRRGGRTPGAHHD
ncbi:hypothetical protein [Georgenia yuyongxinii]|uniref:Uncharacterized protein n=1 Tax=Georgenia yuyongxinii TaxID=2589797 RepID=A0A552WUJ5_9MICO|nr:hypothetical protein [Georgenia yuyongxinii]TRW46386.1 hypothetical protein FJ693_05520 [Georgenia yuyongxinii]